MSRVLIAYATTDGHTRQICERLRQVVERVGHRVTVKLVAETVSADLEACDAVVIGASIRYGKHKPEVAAFIERHRALLEARPNAFFSVNVVARKPGKDVPEGNPYLQKFLRRITWKPQRLDVFAGRIDYPRYSWLDRTMIRFILWMGKGPTDPKGSFEFTDWKRVEAFGAEIAAMAPAATAPGVRVA
jgi:menaquinone-dependent protoporphyrinogen oxidase